MTYDNEMKLKRLEVATKLQIRYKERESLHQTDIRLES